MNGAEEVERLVEALGSDEALRARVERAVLSGRMLSLPEQVARLVTATEDLVAVTARQGDRLERVEDRLERVDERLAELVEVTAGQGERLDRLDERVDRLAERMDRLAERMDQLAERVDRLVEQVAELVAVTTRQGELLVDHQERLGRMDISLGQLKGIHLEEKFARNPGGWVHGLARRARIVALDDLLERLGILDSLSNEDYGMLSQADFYVKGKAPGTGEEVLLVVEATWKAHSRDVERQVARLAILRRYVGRTAAVVVAVEPPIDSVRQAMDDASIVLVVDDSFRSAA